MFVQIFKGIAGKTVGFRYTKLLEFGMCLENWLS